MRSTFMALTIVASLITGLAPAPARAQSGFEPEPVFQAKDLVAADLLKGPQYTLDSRVPVKGLLYRFAITSTYGPFPAAGTHMLQTRLREVYALGQIDQMSKTQEFLDASGRAIARPVTATADLIMNPVQTVESIPSGFGRLFDRIKLGAEAVESAATTPDQSSQQQAEAVSKRVGGITVDALGYEKERRDLAKGLKVDPYTTNPVLSKKLTDMAWVAFSGRFGIQMATSVLVPYSAVLSTATFTHSAIYDTPPGDLINGDQAVFATTGASPAQVAALMKNPHYSLSVLTALAQGVKRLNGVGGLAEVVQFGAIAQTEDEARLVTAAVNMLARHHESMTPLAKVSAPGPIAGHLANGAIVVPAPVDYVSWAERSARFANRADLKVPDRTLWLSGRMSPRALKEFTARGWKVTESHTIGAER